MAKDLKDFETINLFSWLEQKMNDPDSQQEIEDFVLANYRANVAAANDQLECQPVIDKINDVFLRAEEENKVDYIGEEARAAKASRIEALQSELESYCNEMRDWTARYFK